MSETTLRNLLVAGIIFAMLFSGVYSMIYIIDTGTKSLNSSGDTTDNVVGFVQNNGLASFNNSFNKMDSTVKDIDTVSTSLKNAQVSNNNVFSLASAFLTTIWGSITTVFGMFGFVGSMFSDLTSWVTTTTGGGNLGWVAKYIGALVGIVIIFGVIAYILQRNE